MQVLIVVVDTDEKIEIDLCVYFIRKIILLEKQYASICIFIFIYIFIAINIFIKENKIKNLYALLINSVKNRNLYI